MATPYERIAQARSRLAAAGIPPQDASFDAEVLARHALGWDRAHLLAHGRDLAPEGFAERYDALIARRVNREPVAQILGTREFWGLDFEVTPDVLVPRPETELIVEEALAFARAQTCGSVIDIGTGSGCIAISIARELPDVRIIAVDASGAALAVARRNAERLAVADRITFKHSDLFEQVAVTADLIVSNPPYMAKADEHALQPEVVQFEPHAALFGGDDGLSVVRRLFADAHAHLAPDGRLIMEFGFGQEAAVRAAAEDAGWEIVRTRADLQGIPRTIVLRSHV
jgi:release factor glutamine methyltransferase